MIYKILPIVAFFLMSLSSNENAVRTISPKTLASSTMSSFEAEAENIYNSLHSSANLALPNSTTFKKALQGFYKLKQAGKVKRDILTIVDFSISSTQKRMWIIDLGSNTILFNSLVAHGRGTGEEFATNFSNQAESHKSSLGFYTTGEIYQGKHGLSLKLDGQERGVNDNARNRAVVIHGADYVSDSFVKRQGRLGRSHGCPAIPVELTKQIISTIKDKSCLFIFHPSRTQDKLVS